MANSDRKIVRGVRKSGKTYVSGMEDELAKLLSADDVDRLSTKGHIEWKWVAAKTTAPPSEENSTKSDLENLTVAELKDLARDSSVEGFSAMKKDELIEALSKQ